MSSKNINFIGITIGPIFDTILESVSPASMWFASTFFSQVTYNLCSEIVDLCIKLGETDENFKIFSPAFSSTKSENSDLSDGIGKYHDRILFYSSKLTQEKLDEVIISVKQKMSNYFYPKTNKIINFETEFPRKDLEKFLKKYLQINYVIIPEEELVDKNIITVLNGYLDELELMVSFPNSKEKNAFKRIFLGSDKINDDSEQSSRNDFIRFSKLYQSVTKSQNQLKSKKDNSIRSIEKISNQGNNLKTDKYFAVVDSDGDNVGKLLLKMCEDGKDSEGNVKYLPPTEQAVKVKHFSEATLKYSAEAAIVVKKYNGMTIYAGGDDLMFLSPVKLHKDVEKISGNNVLDLCSELNDVFDEHFKKNDVLKEYLKDLPTPSLSFGMSIQYYKFPLYEAFESSRNLLYTAKDTDINPLKNSVVLKLLKHSGQEINMTISNEKLGVLNDLVKNENIKIKTVDTDTTDGKENTKKDEFSSQTINSIIYTLGNMASVIRLLSIDLGLEEFKKRFMNFFDNEGQKKFEPYLKEIAKFYFENILSDDKKIKVELPDEAVDEHIQILQQVLRFKKFFIEKKGEDE